MLEVNNQIKNHIELAMKNNYLKGENQGTLGFGNPTTLVVLQYLFNTVVWVTLGDKYQKDEITIKPY